MEKAEGRRRSVFCHTGCQNASWWSQLSCRAGSSAALPVGVRSWCSGGFTIVRGASHAENVSNRYARHGCQRCSCGRAGVAAYLLTETTQNRFFASHCRSRDSLADSLGLVYPATCVKLQSLPQNLMVVVCDGCKRDLVRRFYVYATVKRTSRHQCGTQ